MRRRGVATLIMDAFDTLLQADGRTLKVIGVSPRDPAAQVELVLDEGPLRMAMLDYSERILGLSIVISLIAAGLVFLSHRRLLVVPLTPLTDQMVGFRADTMATTNVQTGRANW